MKDVYYEEEYSNTEWWGWIRESREEPDDYELKLGECYWTDEDEYVEVGPDKMVHTKSGIEEHFVGRILSVDEWIELVDSVDELISKYVKKLREMESIT